MTAPTMTEIPGCRGDLIAPGDDRYDSARALWNDNVDRRPGLIARCRSTADIAAAVRFARAHDVRIAVRGGGHNVAGTAGCDDGIVIDLSEMCAVSADPVERTARAQGGALRRDVDRATQAYGLATTGSLVGHTGVAGLTLGGGLGWLIRKHGLTVANLVEAEVVTATGDVVQASAPDELGTVIRLGTVPPLPVIPRGLHVRPAVAAAETVWAREFFEALDPHRAGHVNFSTPTTTRSESGRPTAVTRTAGSPPSRRPTTPTTPSTTARTSVPAERGPATIDALDGGPGRLGRGRQPRRRELKHNPRR